MINTSLNQLELTFLLLIVYQLKHFLADFPLQREYMLKKTSANWDFAIPLGLHCLVHSGLTAIIVIYIDSSKWWLIILDFVVHFIMDRIKSGPHYLGRFNDMEKSSYWNCFGLDQMVHHLTHFYIIWNLVS